MIHHIDYNSGNILESRVQGLRGVSVARPRFRGVNVDLCDTLWNRSELYSHEKVFISAIIRPMRMHC